MEKKLTRPTFATHTIAFADFEATEEKTGRISEAFAAGILIGEGDDYREFWDSEAGDYMEDQNPAPVAKGAKKRRKNELTPDAEYDYFRKGTAANQLFDFLDTVTTPLIVYLHNGGRYDIRFFAHRLASQSFISNGSRVLAIKYGIHEIRDSAALIPMRLKEGGTKGSIDFGLHAKAKRENPAVKAEILAYLRQDCYSLRSLVMPAIKSFCTPTGHTKPHMKTPIPLTVSGAAFSKLRKIEKLLYKSFTSDGFITRSRDNDKLFREAYYGGHVECFEIGDIKAPEGMTFTMYDVNSMYPYVMSAFSHPISDNYLRIDKPELSPEGWIVQKTRVHLGGGKYREEKDFERFKGKTYFLRFKGKTRGLPRRVEFGPDKSTRLDFGEHTGEHFYCSHEIIAAMEYGLIQIDEIVSAYVAHDQKPFTEFVTTYYKNRQEIAPRIAELEAKAKVSELTTDEKDEYGDLKARDALYKTTLNGAYGKFAFDFRNYRENFFINYVRDIREAHEFVENNGVKIVEGGVRDSYTRVLYELGEGKTSDERYYGVATAASITSAARSILLHAIMNSVRPIYCDTDSLLCLELKESHGVRIQRGDKKLGEWGVDKANIDRVAIVGRKLYALFSGDKCVKYSAKGYSLGDKSDKSGATRAGNLLLDAVYGTNTMISSPFAAYKLGKGYEKIERELKMTKEYSEIMARVSESERVQQGMIAKLAGAKTTYHAFDELPKAEEIDDYLKNLGGDE